MDNGVPVVRESAERTDRLGQILRDNGFRLTDARHHILQALVGCQGHVSADDLVAIVRRRAPQVGRMTVYRTLDLLAELALIRPVYQGTGAAHYILLEDGHHHHLVCSGCAEVIEFEHCVVEEISQTISRHFDFEIQGHLLEFFGRCQACRQEEEAA